MDTVGISLTERKNIITDFSNFSFLLKLRKVRILITLTVVAGASILLLFSLIVNLLCLLILASICSTSDINWISSL
jgi:hypothetical protein